MGQEVVRYISTRENESSVHAVEEQDVSREKKGGMIGFREAIHTPKEGHG